MICIAIVIAFLLKNLSRYFAQYYLTPIRTGVVKDIERRFTPKCLYYLFHITQKKET